MVTSGSASPVEVATGFISSESAQAEVVEIAQPETARRESLEGRPLKGKPLKAKPLKGKPVQVHEPQLPVTQRQATEQQTSKGQATKGQAAQDRFAMLALSPVAGERVLELNCGTGRRLLMLAKSRALGVGIDASNADLRRARQRLAGLPPSSMSLNSSPFVLQGDTEQALPFIDGCFDAVLCVLAGEPLVQIQSVFYEIHRILHPRGRLVLSLSYPEITPVQKKGDSGNTTQSLWQVEFELRSGPFRHAISDYVQFLEQAGFFDIRRHHASHKSDQTDLFEDRSLPPAEREFPPHVVIQAFKPK